MGNANSGRKPVPTALKVLRGNPGQRKLPENEPLPPLGDVVKPAELSAAGEQVWDELAPICLAMGTLTTADLKAFTTLCELQATFTAAARAKGSANFDARLERDTANALRPYYSEFGLTPVSRARISVPKKAGQEQASKWAGVLK